MANIASHIYDFVQKHLGIHGNGYENELAEIIKPLGDLSGKHILEIGAGTCKVSIYIKHAFPSASMVATDISSSHLSLGKKKAGIETIVSPTETLPQVLKQKFDIIIGVDTLHHHFNRVVTLENCYLLLKPGGILLLREVSRQLPGYFFYSLVDKSDFIFSLFQGLKYIDPGYLSHDEYISLLRALGFTQIEYQPLGRLGLMLVEAKKS